MSTVQQYTKTYQQSNLEIATRENTCSEREAHTHTHTHTPLYTYLPRVPNRLRLS